MSGFVSLNVATASASAVSVAASIVSPMSEAEISKQSLTTDVQVGAMLSQVASKIPQMVSSAAISISVTPAVKTGDDEGSQVLKTLSEIDDHAMKDEFFLNSLIAQLKGNPKLSKEDSDKLGQINQRVAKGMALTDPKINPAVDLDLPQIMQLKQAAELMVSLLDQVNSLTAKNPTVSHSGDAKTESKSESKAEDFTLKNNFQDKGFVIFFDDKDMKSQTDDAFYLVNAFPSLMELFGLKFTCSENAYHAAKYIYAAKQLPDSDSNKQFLLQLAKKYADVDGFKGYEISRTKEMSDNRPKDWYEIKANGRCPAQEAFLEILLVKFSDEKLKAKLLATGSAYLVEHWPNRATVALGTTDARWADAHDGSGTNWMGLLLMEVRGLLGGVGIVEAPESYINWVAENSY